MGAVDAAARPPAAARVFVGRAEELSELHAALRGSAAARPGCSWSPVRRGWAGGG